MITLDEHRRVARSAADCYRYLADFSTCEQWDPAVYRAVKTTPGAPGIGTEFRVHVRGFGRRLGLRYRVEDLVPGQLIRISGRGAGFRTDERISFAPHGESTTDIYYHAEFSLTGPLARAATVVRPLLARMGRRAVDGLADALTIGHRAPRQGWLSYAADRSIVVGDALYTDRGYLAMRNKAHSRFIDDATVVVTGATGGIGRAIAAEYARLGAALILVGRDSRRLADAAHHVRDFSGAPAGRVATVEADMLDMAQVAAAAGRIAAAHPRIDVLVNNAGAMFHERAETAEGIERTLAVNLAAPFVFTENLMPCLLPAGARVINMSSGGMYAASLSFKQLNGTGKNNDGGRYHGLTAYAHAKRALVALTGHWARRYGDAGVHFNAMHPGWVATRGVADALPRFNRLLGPVLRDARMGADTAVWLGASAAAAGCNGEFFFDRVPRTKALIPGTAAKPSEAQSLYAWLRNTTGVSVHGLR